MFSNDKKKSSPSKRTYQTALNFAPPVRVRRPDDKTTAKKHKRATGGCAASAGADHAASSTRCGRTGGAAGTSSSKNEADATTADNVAAKQTSVTTSPPSIPTAISTQLDDSDSGRDIDGSNMHRKASAKERRRAAAARLRERKKRHAASTHRAALADTDDEVEEDIASDTGKPTGSESSKRAGKPKARKRLGQKKRNSRRIAVEEEIVSDDDDLDDFIADSSEDDDHLDDEHGQQAEDEEEREWTKKEVGKERTDQAAYGDDGEQDDEPMSHAALSFHMQMTRHDEEQKVGLAEIMSANRPLSEREAFGIWLEDLALQADAHRKTTRHVSSLKQQKAASQIERPLCTRRESALGSSAWRKEFRDELKQRPVYRSFELHKLAVPGNVSNCGACGRSSHNITHRIELSGPRYNADRTWECSRDLKHPDWSVCLGRSPETLEEDEDDLSDTVTFFVGGHCKARTELYHDLLHYKFRVFDSIQGMLSGDRSNVAIRMQLKENGQTMDQFLRKKNNCRQNYSADSDGDSEGKDEGSSSTSISVQELIKNKGYVDREYERSRMLVEDAEENWGGLKGVMDFKDSVRPRAKRNVIKMIGPEVGKRRSANITSAGKKRIRLQKNQTRLEFPSTKKK